MSAVTSHCKFYLTVTSGAMEIACLENGPDFEPQNSHTNTRCEKNTSDSVYLESGGSPLCTCVSLTIMEV